MDGQYEEYIMALSETGQKALDLFKQGKDPAEAVETSVPGQFEESSPEPIEKGSIPGLDDYLSQESEPAESEPEKPEAESAEASSESTESEDDQGDDPELSKEGEAEKDHEYVVVTDHTGKRKKLKVDYSDRDKIKKAFQMQAGARKWQAERDDLKKRWESAEPKVQSWDKLEEIYKEEGAAGLVNFLEDDPEAFTRLVDEDLARRNASPEELEQYRQKDEERARKKREEEFERKQRELAEKEEAIETQLLESQIHPSFDRYRFAGKLGDADQENMLDEMVWNNALKRLEDYPEDVTLSQSMIDKEFRKVANSVRKLVNTQAKNQTKKIVKDKKSKAQERTQMAAMKGMGGQAKAAAELKDSIRSGNTAGILSNILKRGS